MRILIAEDDYPGRKFLAQFMAAYGDCDQVVDGMEALEAFTLAMEESRPYRLICLDIMMPKVDGVKVLKAIRNFEIQQGILPEKRAKVLMITALAETGHVHQALEIGCDGYVAKPVGIAKLTQILAGLGFSP
ncbi:two-component system chemotaxis response regulator CheY [Hydrogenispora ethanolica]|jgi:two-component system chemotaxis response regulator CheY|uniref:Two-component system chemotaxis response regulator CheY n=1 Tax=Hydrogenispora ethanolica TaxID=1082276 RepID=A0A4R1RI47_HYDET|nr:response regulator [Hydrogenispora ethanolica]TCL65312.1 two-component system chemotaxis response regulator CheY [Hydrogenispora ethanolica]